MTAPAGPAPAGDPTGRLDPASLLVPGPGEPDGGWRRHMPLEAEGRRRKAAKIAHLLGAVRPLEGADLLEVGTGIGVIAAELAALCGPSGSVTSVDTVDTRLVTDGYTYLRTAGVALPFENARFDVVVTNHVIEHVGGRVEQEEHLREIARVLRPDGVAYLATPSRWAVVEPHFRVPLLSWPPRSLRTPMLRASRRGVHYDVDPLGPVELGRLVAAAGLAGTDQTVAAVQAVIAEHSGTTVGRAAARVPAGVIRALRPAAPTMIYLLRRA